MTGVCETVSKYISQTTIVSSYKWMAISWKYFNFKMIYTWYLLIYFAYLQIDSQKFCLSYYISSLYIL